MADITAHSLLEETMRKVVINGLLLTGIVVAGVGIVALLGARQIVYAQARHELSIKTFFASYKPS